MSAVLSSVFGAGAQLFDNAGRVLAGGKLFSYLAGSITPQATWTSGAQTVQNANPIILDSAGRISYEVWLSNGLSYKFVVQDSQGNTLTTFDNIPGINSSSVSLSEWVAGSTATYVGATSFTVLGNQVAAYQVNRRVQYALSGGTYYGTVLTSTYNGSTLTTVVITADSTGLDASVLAVNYGFMSAINTSVPVIFVPINNPTFTGTVTIPAGAAIAGYAKLTRSLSAASYTTDTGTSLNCDNYDAFNVTAQAGALKFNNPTGTPISEQALVLRIKDNGTARALTYDTQFRPMGTPLPSTTVISKTLYLGLLWNATDTKWDLVAARQEV